jgi:hypothetical protein
VSIKGNETADKAAKEALNQEVDNTYKMVKSETTDGVHKHHRRPKPYYNECEKDLMVWHLLCGQKTT